MSESVGALFPCIKSSASAIEFPPAEAAIPEGPYKGLVAVGGDLSEAQLLTSYRHGIFPWSVNPVTWW